MATFQAITTRYFGQGNVRGSRIKATAAAGSITVHYDDALNATQNHVAAAKAVANTNSGTAVPVLQPGQTTPQASDGAAPTPPAPTAP